MSEQPKQLSYTAPPGVVLRKASVPYDYAATIAALTSGIPEKADAAVTNQYARAPQATGLPAGVARPSAAQTRSR